jgi:hypothetical protein
MINCRSRTHGKTTKQTGSRKRKPMPKQTDRNLKKQSEMKRLIAVFASIILLSSCSPVYYLSNHGEVVYVADEWIEVTFPCENTGNPKCYAIARVSKSNFPFAYIGQKITMQDAKIQD